jgi:hypothetical protein
MQQGRRPVSVYRVNRAALCGKAVAVELARGPMRARNAVIAVLACLSVGGCESANPAGPTPPTANAASASPSPAPGPTPDPASGPSPAPSPSPPLSPSPAPGPTPTPNPTPSPSPSPAPAPRYTYFGVVSDGQGSPVAGVTIRAETATAVSDTSGRYEFRSQQQSLTVTGVLPPNGYEGSLGGHGYGILTPGSRDFVVRKVVKLTLTITAPVVPVSDGTLWYGVSPTVEYGTGETVRLTGIREEAVVLTTSDPSVLKTRRDSGRPVVEGISPGTAVLTGGYWGVASAPVIVQVIPRSP